MHCMHVLRANSAPLGAPQGRIWVNRPHPYIALLSRSSTALHAEKAAIKAALTRAPAGVTSGFKCAGGPCRAPNPAVPQQRWCRGRPASTFMRRLVSTAAAPAAALLPPPSAPGPAAALLAPAAGPGPAAAPVYNSNSSSGASIGLAVSKSGAMPCRLMCLLLTPGKRA